MASVFGTCFSSPTYTLAPQAAELTSYLSGGLLPSQVAEAVYRLAATPVLPGLRYVVMKPEEYFDRAVCRRAAVPLQDWYTQ